MLELNTIIFDFLSRFKDFAVTGFLADIPIFFLPLFLTGMWIYYSYHQSDRQNKIRLLHIFYSCILAIVFSYIIKQFVEIDRPENYLKNTQNLIMSTIPEKSFPSDHASVSVAFLVGLFFSGFIRVGYVFLPFVIIMNLARIAGGIHWPLDILAGTLVGISATSIFFLMLKEKKWEQKLSNTIISTMNKIYL